MLGFDVSPVLQYVIAFAIVAALLALFAVVLRRIGGKRFALPGQGGGGRGRQPRLGVVDVYDLDRQRQLVLLRRDNVEHLVMLGGPNDLVVEANIQRMQTVRQSAPEYERAAQPEAPEALQARRPVEPPLAASAGLAPAAPPRVAQPLTPAAEMAPRPQAAPVPPQPAPQPPQAAPLAPAPVAPAPVAPEPSPAPRAAAAASIEQPPQKPFGVEPHARPDPLKPEPVVQTAQEAPAAQEQNQKPKRSLFGFGRAAEAPTPPPAFPTRPRTTPVPPDFPVRAPVRPATAEDGRAEASLAALETALETPPPAKPADNAAAPAAAPVEAEAPAPVAAQLKPAEPKPAEPHPAESPAESPADSRPAETKPAAATRAASLDDEILSDMARQLEEALKRPQSAASALRKPAEPAPASRPVPPGAGTAPPAERATSAASVFLRPTQPRPPIPELRPAAADGGAGRAPGLRVQKPMEAGPDQKEEQKAQAPASEAKPGEDKPGEDKSSPVSVAAAAASAVAMAFRPQGAPAAEAASSNPPARFAPLVEEERDEATPTEAGKASDAAKEIAPASDVVSGSIELPQLGVVREAGAGAGDDRIAVAPEPEALEASKGAGQPASKADARLPPVDEPTTETPEGEKPAAEEAARDASAEEKPASGAEGEAEAASAGTDEQPREQQKSAAIDPFSVDEIEAEFARLLGRSVEKDSKRP